jgi:uncharacterized protein YbjT (DUF2867 family)
MRVVIFGATGMVGQGVLRECLLDQRVSEVVSVGRRALGRTDPKLREVVRPDVTDLGPVESSLSGVDACFFCLGVSSAGMSESAYRAVTYDLTLSIAHVLARLNPGLVFTYVSGRGTNADGRAMWQRVKGATENDLLDLDVRGYMFRPGIIRPLHGEGSKTFLYRAAYVVATPLFPLLRRFAPQTLTTTEALGRAMVEVAVSKPDLPILETPDINRYGQDPRN